LIYESIAQRMQAIDGVGGKGIWGKTVGVVIRDPKQVFPIIA